MSSAPVVTASDWLAPYPPPRSLTLDQEALRVYERAYYLGTIVNEREEKADPPISFTILAAALLLGEDETSRWFAEKAGALGPNREAVLAEKTITADELSRAAQQQGPPQPESIRLSSDKQLLTGSSRAVLESAENWAQRVGGSDIGVRHLLAAYVVNPPAYHRKQLKEWKLNENLWRGEFFDWVGARFSWEQWVDASQRAAPAQSRVAFEQPEVKGRSLNWPGDERARRVLEEAAEWHRHRSDAWLGYSTLVFALVRSSENDAAIRGDVQPIWDAVQKNQAKYLEAFSGYFPADPIGAQLAFDDLDISPRVLNTLETARELATAARARLGGADGGVKVGPLHLAGALASPRVDAAAELNAIGIDVPELRKALVAYAAGRDESVEVWREILGEEETLLTGRPVDLNSDEPEAVVRLDESWASDPLAIRPDVEAFAALLASRELEPPLSIGLFGPWGSGKTTFLKRLRRAVQRHADDARQHPSAGGPYVPNVVHVEFNAWHFAEDALVSSLVDATIRQIRDFVKADPVLGPANWLEAKLRELESRRRQVDAAKDLHAAAAKAVTTAEAALATQEKAAELRQSSLRNAVGVVWHATASALVNDEEVKDSGVLNAIGSTVDDLDELRQRVDRLRARPGRMLGDLGWGRSAFFAALVLIVPPLVAIAVERVTGTFDFRAILSSITGLVAALGIWAKAASGAVTRMDRAAARVVAEYEKQIARDPDVLAAQASVKEAQARAQTAAATLQASRDALARAEAEAANASLPAQTLQLVSSRIQDRSYAKELTTLSLARADLEMLSLILRAQRTDGGQANNTLRAVDRVILYIDDLDRCKPEDVVRVLQLVHMLLAFELFVVVVAVDARWVEQALRYSYRWLSRGGSPVLAGEPRDGSEKPAAVEPFGPVTPEDYLEKIFQIAFWLEPMTAGRAASYLASLVRPATDATKVDISSVELDYMRALAAYVGTSPRRVKRLVNAYRLIKARLSDAQLSAFVTDSRTPDAKAKSGPYQIVIGLLVIGTGAQSASSAILGALGEWDPRAKYEEVVNVFRDRKDPDWTVAAQVIETIMRTQNATDVSELRGWARQVRRFLLHGPGSDRSAAAPPPPVVH
jgi:predicted KAP-like P-loop ATPase